jgi:hypothetical protein
MVVMRCLRRWQNDSLQRLFKPSHKPAGFFGRFGRWLHGDHATIPTLKALIRLSVLMGYQIT